MQEAPYSLNYFLVTPEGAKGQVTVRSENKEDFIERLQDITETLLAMGYDLSGNNVPARQHAAGPAPTTATPQAAGDYPLPTKTQTYVGYMAYNGKGGEAIVFYESGMKFQSLAVYREELPLIQSIADEVDWANVPSKYEPKEDAELQGYYVPKVVTLEVEQRIDDKTGELAVNKNGYPVFNRISMRPEANQHLRQPQENQQPPANAGSQAAEVKGNDNLQLRNMQALAQDVYGEEAEMRLKAITASLSRNQTDDPAKLTPDQMEQAIQGMQTKLAEMQEEIPF